MPVRTVLVCLAVTICGASTVDREPIAMGERVSFFSKILGEERVVHFILSFIDGFIESLNFDFCSL